MLFIFLFLICESFELSFFITSFFTKGTRECNHFPYRYSNPPLPGTLTPLPLDSQQANATMTQTLAVTQEAAFSLKVKMTAGDLEAKGKMAIAATKADEMQMQLARKDCQISDLRACIDSHLQVRYLFLLRNMYSTFFIIIIISYWENLILVKSFSSKYTIITF